MHRGSAIAEGRRSSASRCLSQSVRTNVPDRAVWKRAVVKRVSWGHWLRALRRLLTGGRTADRYILMSGLSSVLRGIPDTKFTEWGIAVAKAASVASLPSDSATYDAGCAVETAQLPNASWEQQVSSVFLPHVHDPSVGGCFMSGAIWTALCTTKVLSGMLFRSWRFSGIPHC